MAVIIDAYNVLHCTHILPDPWGTMEVPLFCEFLARSRFASTRVAVVCDGTPPLNQPPANPAPGIRVIYAGGGKDADSLIEKMIARADGPRDLVVVSNDNRIRRAARRRRATPMASEIFLKECLRSFKPGDSPATASSPDPAADTEHWLQTFDLSESDLEALDEKAAGENDLYDWQGISAELRREMQEAEQAATSQPGKQIKTFDPARAERERAEAATQDWLQHFGLNENDLADLESQTKPTPPPPTAPPKPSAKTEKPLPPSLDDDQTAGTDYWLRAFGLDKNEK